MEKINKFFFVITYSFGRLEFPWSFDNGNSSLCVVVMMGGSLAPDFTHIERKQGSTYQTKVTKEPMHMRLLGSRGIPPFAKPSASSQTFPWVHLVVVWDRFIKWGWVGRARSRKPSWLGLAKVKEFPRVSV